MRTGNLSTWLLRGTYPRLFVPIVLIIALVTGVRYHLLVASETAEVRRHAASELRRVADAMLPAMSSLPAWDTPAQASRLQEGLARLGPGIQTLSWQAGNHPAVDAAAPGIPATAPPWFTAWLDIAPPPSILDRPWPAAPRGASR